LHFDAVMTPLDRSRSRDGFTLIELLIVVALIGILAALGAPFMIAAKGAANESSAVGSLRTLNTAQVAYQASCGASFYSPTIAHLVAEGFAGPDLDVSPKSGYTFALTPSAGGRPGGTDCTGAASQGDYYASALRVSPDTGRRGFATNHVGTIWQDTAGVPPAEPFVEAGTVSPLRGQ
jgi:prepilin-type N-terminal cleavage/methylation domain-containing protein